jgi:F-box and WD-40 domain protein CDC4
MATFKTASASANGEQANSSISKWGRNSKRVHHMEPSTAVGQFSFAPATQTTVVTTTTTTTTKFPPLLLRPPKHAGELDSKLYPLANTPTPTSLKNISFVIDGKLSKFHEAENSSAAIKEVSRDELYFAYGF